MEYCSVNYTVFEKKTFVLLFTISTISMMFYTLIQFLQIDLELLKQGKRDEMHMVNFTSILTFFSWCIAFGINKDLMLGNINNN